MIFDLHECFEDAAERAGMELRTGFDYKSMRRTLHFLLREWANDGYNLYSIEPATIALVEGTATYTLPADLIDVSDAVIRLNAGTTIQSDVSMVRTSIADYHNQNIKLNRGRPYQFVVERLLVPTLTVWPVPNGAYTLAYWYMKYTLEPDAGGAVPAVPDRFIPALISGLAFHLAMKRPVLADRVMTLKAEYDRQWMLAKEEDRDKANFFVAPAMR